MGTRKQGAPFLFVFPQFEATRPLASKQRDGEARMEADIKPVGFIRDFKSTTLQFTGCMTWAASLNPSLSIKQGQQGSLASLTERIN